MPSIDRQGFVSGDDAVAHLEDPDPQVVVLDPVGLRVETPSGTDHLAGARALTKIGFERSSVSSVAPAAVPASFE